MLRTLSLAAAAAALLGTMASSPSDAAHPNGSLICHFKTTSTVGAVKRVNRYGSIRHLIKHTCSKDYVREDYLCSNHPKVGGSCRSNECGQKGTAVC